MFKNGDCSAQAFTFVGYDINSRGVSNVARSHLMEIRARNKRASQERSRPKSLHSALPWRCAETEEGGTPKPIAQRPIKQRSAKRETSQNRRPVIRSGSSLGSSQVSSACQSPDGSVESLKGGDDYPLALSATHIDELATDIEQFLQAPSADKRMSSTEENALLRIANQDLLPNPWKWTSSETSPSQPSGSPVKTCDKQNRQSMVVSVPWPLFPPEILLYQYFLANGATMMRFDLYWDIVAPYKPVESIFLPIAFSARWCFEAMILLFSAHHRRHSQIGLWKTSDRQITVIQNQVLKAAHDRITAVAENGDSNDADVMAFLFLAIVELRFGDEQTGLIHLDAWQQYLVMRRERGVAFCGTACKIAVWWCISMLLPPDYPLPAMLDCKIVKHAKEDPARLFRCLATESLPEDIKVQ